MKTLLQDFFEITDSFAGRRKATLRFAICFMLFTTIIYFFLDQKFGHYAPIWLYPLKIVVCLVSFGLLKLSVEWAIAFFLVAFNSIFFLTMQSEPFQSGFNFHMFTFGFLAMFLYGHQKKWIGVGFAVLSAILVITSQLWPTPFLEYRHYTDHQTLFYFIVNSLIFVLFTPTLLLFTISWNFETEKKLVKQRILADEQNKLMVKTNEDLDRFVYKTSHELRAPLNEILQMAIDAKKSRDQRQLFFDQMKTQVGLMEEYIREIIDYSRNSRIDVKWVTVNVSRLIEEVWASLAAVPGFNSIEFSAHVAEEQLVSDPDRLKMILRNLAFNAIKYRDLCKPMSFVCITAGGNSLEYWIKVSDNGIGIDPHHQEQILEMFNDRTQQSNGSGLGLYTVKETINKLGGSLSLRSIQEQGSEFTVTLIRKQDKASDE